MHDFVALHCCWHLVVLSIFLFFLYLSNFRVYKKKNLIVVLACISLMTSVTEHLIRCFFPSCIFFGEVPVQIFSSFYWVFGLLSTSENSSYVLDTHPLSGMCFTNIFSQPVLVFLSSNIFQCFSVSRNL